MTPPYPDAGIEKDHAYFRFWRAVAIGTAIWGLSVLALLGLIGYTIASR